MLRSVSPMKKGDLVETVYGPGFVDSYRKIDQIYCIQLETGATLYCRNEALKLDSLELNVAYELLEKMRKLNLAVVCKEAGIEHVDHEQCSFCLLANIRMKEKDEPTEEAELPKQQNRFPRMKQFAQKLTDHTVELQKKTQAALQQKEPIIKVELPQQQDRFPRIKQFAQKLTDQTVELQKKTQAALQQKEPIEVELLQQQDHFTRIKQFAQKLSNHTVELQKKTQAALQQKEPITEVELPPQQDHFPQIKQFAQKLSDHAVEQQKKTQAALRHLQHQSKLPNMNKSPPCLICGTPVCRQHSSASFRKEANITMCCQCETIFGMNYVIDVLTENDERERQAHIYRLTDMYDRVVLLLKYSAQYMDDIAAHLEAKTVRQNRVALGSTATGMVSGVLGLAAVGALFTPAGPPLLVASLLCGGSATAVQTGTEARNHFSEPNRLADRILALHGVLLNILRVTGMLRDALVLDHVRTDPDEDKQVTVAEASLQVLEKHKVGILAGVTVGRYGMAAAETGSILTRGRTARFFTRGGTAAMRSLRFARFAGGTLAVATLVLEANNFNSTLKDIQAGDPCEKAEKLRSIKAEIVNIPTTAELDEECQIYLDMLARRQHVMTEEEVTQLLIEQNEEILLEERQVEQQDQLSAQEEEEGFVVVTEEYVEDSTSSSIAVK